MKFLRRTILFLTFLLVLVSCKNSKVEKIEYKKFSRTFFGVFDTEIAFTAYCKDEKEFNEYFTFLESDMKKYHNLYNSFENVDFNNIKTINDNAGKKPVEVDREIIELLEFSIDSYKKVSDKNSVAIGAVTSLWKTQKDLAVDLQGQLPNGEKISQALNHINIDNIVIDKVNNTVYLKDEFMKLDVGAIAKGYSVEKVINKLKDKGLKNLIISAGGNVKAIGTPKEKDKNKWGIGIQLPKYDSGNIEIKDVIFSEETCAVTSGDYQRFFYVDGKVYNHIIDPKTGYPNDKIKSVTVLYKDSAMADFLSTSLFLQTVEEGKETLSKIPGAEAFWILPDGSVDYTKGMEIMLKSKGATNK